MQDKLGNESAYPFFTWNVPGYGECVTIQDKDGNMNHLEYTPGISKRFWAVCTILPGILNNPNVNRFTTQEHVRDAYEIVDELLAQENK